MKNRVLITGLEGFTGVHLEEVLQKSGFEVFGTSLTPSTKSNIFTCNITKRDEIEAIVLNVQPSYIIHLAAISFVGEKNASLIYDVNVIGTENLLEALLKLPFTPKKVILASSATVYGNQNRTILDETMCPAPVNHYGYSKLAMEHLAKTYCDKLPILITRPFNYTGVGQAEHFLIPKIVKHYKEHLSKIELGNLDVAREFNDVRDVASWYAQLLLSEKQNEIVNLCSGNAISLLEIIEHMNHLAGYTINIEVNPAFVRDNEIKLLLGSPNKLISLIHTLPNYKISATLEAMYTCPLDVK